MGSLYHPGFPFNKSVIPRRLTLAGLLSWRQPATLQFPDGITLLTGGNGRGKSAIVDAITFALFARHRAGAGPADLLHTDADQLQIEFEFEQDHVRYCIHRTIRRSRQGVHGTQHIETLRDNEWQRIPETDRRAGFDDWIRTHTGWTWEAFRVAVLLAQGNADRLLEESPATRAEIIATVAGVSELQTLHELAEHDARKAKAVLETLTDQSICTPRVTDTDVAAAVSAVEQAERDAATARERVLHLRRQRELAEELATATGRLAETEAILREAATLDADVQRRDELAVIVPRTEAVLTARTRILDSQHKSERMQARQSHLVEFQTITRTQLATHQAEHALFQNRIMAADTALAQLARQRREQDQALHAQRQWEALQPERDRLHTALAEYPAITEADVTAVQAQCDHLLRIGQWLPTALRVQDEEQECRAHEERRGALAADSDRIRHEGEVARRRHDDLKAAVLKAIEARVQAEAAVSEARRRLERANADCGTITTMSGESTCTACGQPLTPAHLESEIHRRQATRTAVQQQLQQCEMVRGTAVRMEHDLQTELDLTTHTLNKLRTDFARSSAELQHQTDALTHKRQNIAAIDWPADLPRDVAVLQREFATLAAVKQQLQQLREQWAARTALLHQVQTLDQAMARWQQQLPKSDRTAVVAEMQRLQDAEADQLQTLKAERAALTECERIQDRLARAAHEALTEATDLTGRLLTEERTRRQLEAIIPLELGRVPAPWQSRVAAAGSDDLMIWKQQLAELQQAHLPGKRWAIEAAREEHAQLQERVNMLTFANTKLPAVAEDLSTAEFHAAIADENARQAHRHRLRLEAQQEQQAHISAQARAAAEEYRETQRLATLLGPQGLQRHLIRDTEQRIVDHVNRVLAHGGDHLQLRLAIPGDTAAALTLEAVTTTVTRPLPVAFLSAGQRVRVALALARGLGAAVKSSDVLILDDVTGPLDAAGRAAFSTMIQQWKADTKTILLFSHDDLPGNYDRHYRIEFRDGSSVAIRNEGGDVVSVEA